MFHESLDRKVERSHCYVAFVPVVGVVALGVSTSFDSAENVPSPVVGRVTALGVVAANANFRPG